MATQLSVVVGSYLYFELPPWARGMIDLVRRKWAEILILAIMIPSFGFLINFVVNYGERLARQEARTDSIIAALPDLRTRVAFESVYSAFKTALIVSKPYMQNASWKSDIHIVDAEHGKTKKYIVILKGRDDVGPLWTIAGSVQRLDNRAVPFSKMVGMGVTLKFKEYPPTFIDKETSFIVYKSAAKIESRLKYLGFKYNSGASVPKVRTWAKLLRALNSNQMKSVTPP